MLTEKPEMIIELIVKDIENRIKTDAISTYM